MAVKVTKKVKYATALYHKINANILHEKFHAFFKKCTPFGLCRPTIQVSPLIIHKHYVKYTSKLTKISL